MIHLQSAIQRALNYARHAQELLGEYTGDDRNVMNAHGLVGNAIAALAKPRVILTEQNAAERIADMMMDVRDAFAAFPEVSVDERAWEHLLVYRPKAVDVEAIKREVRAFRYPEGHSGIPCRVHQAQHISDEQLIDHLHSRNMLGVPEGFALVPIEPTNGRE